jgi:hypothetical protein
MDFIKDGITNLKSLGFGAAVPGLRDKLVNMINPDEDAKKEEMRRIAQEEITSGKKAATGMKKGGKVSSASKRADGCAVKGKTKGRMV